MTVDLKTLRQLAEAATPGPWQSGHWYGQCREVHLPHPGRPECKYQSVLGEGYGVASNLPGISVVSDEHIQDADAAYITAANPQTLLALLDELESWQDQAGVAVLLAQLNRRDK